MVQLPWLLKKAVLVLNTLEVCSWHSHQVPQRYIAVVRGCLRVHAARKVRTCAPLRACFPAVAMHLLRLPACMLGKNEDM